MEIQWKFNGNSMGEHRMREDKLRKLTEEEKE